MEDGYTRTWIITKSTRINEYVYALPVEECVFLGANNTTDKNNVWVSFEASTHPDWWGGCGGGNVLRIGSKTTL